MLKYHIQTIEVGSGGATNITFNNIPADYTDLYLVTSLRVASGTSYYWDVDLNINGESAREWRGFYALGTSVSTNGSTAFNIVGGANGNGTTASTFSNIDTLITNYASTDVKALSSAGVAENDSSSQYLLTINANRITNSAPINSLTLVVASNSFAEHSSASLYGIKHGVDGVVEAAADGGAITQSGGYTIHTFTASGTFVANRDMDVEYVVVAGGGGGARQSGGGGAGGYRSSVVGESSGGGSSAEDKLRITSGTSYLVEVGAGGSGGSTLGASGSSSALGPILSVGGGRAGQANTSFVSGANGGSGGGGWGASGLGGSPTSNQGYAGGAGNGTDPASAGGGGGASSIGADATTSSAGNGGSGITSSITGFSIGRGGGGGGGAVSSRTAGTATDGGGSGTNTNTGAAGSGTANTGGGGGGSGYVQGSSNTSTGGNGGSGVVIIRYPTPA